MWVTNIEYVINTEGRVSNSENYAIKDGDNYTLIKSNGDKLIVSASRLTFKEKDGRDIVVNREGIAYDLGLISPALSEEEAAKEAKDMLGTITIFFMIAYGISQLVSGKMYDKIGTRKGFSISVLLWGAADALTSMSCGLLSLTSFRMMLGLGEAGPWPGTTKSNAEWFPQKERALAQGLFGAAASLGSIIAPIIILMIYIAFGWKITFVIVGCLGLIWIIPWLIFNKKGPAEHPWITSEEKDYILTISQQFG